MNTRPSPHTPYELKKRLEEEQAYYENYAHGPALAGVLGSLVIGLASLLESAGHGLRSLAATEDRPRHPA